MQKGQLLVNSTGASADWMLYNDLIHLTPLGRLADEGEVPIQGPKKGACGCCMLGRTGASRLVGVLCLFPKGLLPWAPIGEKHVCFGTDLIILWVSTRSLHMYN